MPTSASRCQTPNHSHSIINRIVSILFYMGFFAIKTSDTSIGTIKLF